MSGAAKSAETVSPAGGDVQSGAIPASGVVRTHETPGAGGDVQSAERFR